MERDDDVRGVAVHRLVDRVVEDLPDEMVQAGGADAADVHAWTLANRLEAFEDGDVFCCICGHFRAGFDFTPPVAVNAWRQTVRRIEAA